MESVKIDPYVAEIMKRNERMAYLLGKTEALLATITGDNSLKQINKFAYDEILILVDELDDYYGDL